LWYNNVIDSTKGQKMSDLRGDDVIDSRDVIARIEELETDKALALEDDQDFDEEELDALIALREQCEDYGDWPDGTTLVAWSYWEKYVQELCEDIGDLPRNMPDYIVIDWQATADNIAQDYVEVDFDGESYYIRAC
jgi:hypothetical protein